MKISRFYQVFLIVLCLCAVSCLVWVQYSSRREVLGREHAPKELHGWLTRTLETHFGWSALPVTNLEGAWVQGARDRMYIFRARLARLLHRGCARTKS